eukprot:6204307-Pleurochrysis_carterae.AAC.1
MAWPPHAWPFPEMRRRQPRRRRAEIGSSICCCDRAPAWTSGVRAQRRGLRAGCSRAARVTWPFRSRARARSSCAC